MVAGVVGTGIRTTREVRPESWAERWRQLRRHFQLGAKRRYKIPYFCTAGKYANRSFTKYYPSETGWTEKQSVTIELSGCK